MRRILISCMLSLVIYGLAFGLLLDRPLTLGVLREHIDANLDRGAAITGPKLVILAGSNGPYSHRCEMIGPLVGRPCINAGVAVGVGLDYLFTRWKPLLHPGDLVYLPLEEAQYPRDHAASDLGPDAAIMLRHDHATLWQMPARRELAALFSSDLRAAIMSLLETALLDTGFHDPRTAAAGSTNVWGDHVGHTRALAAANRTALAAEDPYHPAAAQIANGYGTDLVQKFLVWAAHHQVRVIGGLPTGFDDSPISDSAVAAIESIYRSVGAGFLELPGRSRYPRSAFFDSPDHLNEAAQIAHSLAVGRALRRMTGGVISPSRPSPVRLATTGPDPSPEPLR
jgi:hypothetical protein